MTTIHVMHLSAMAVAALVAAALAQTVPQGYSVTPVVEGLESPTTMAFLAHRDALVLEKDSGRVQRVQWTDGGATIETVLTLAVDNLVERGLLGITLAPDFAATHHVYLYYTTAACDYATGNHIERYTWTGSALVDPQLIATLPCGGDMRHNGGIITFGPDGKLYAVIGDLFRSGLSVNFANGILEDIGVVLRLNPDGSIPADNPFTTPGWTRFYAYGVRNSFGLTFDPVTQALWMTENGPFLWDEVNRVLPGFNSGWVWLMGPDASDPHGLSDLILVPGASYSDPEFAWNDTIAPTAILFLDTPRFHPGLRNDCAVGDFFGNVYLFNMNAARSGFALSGSLADNIADTYQEGIEVRWASELGTVTDLKLGPDGYLYAVSFANGAVYRMRPDVPMGDINQDGRVDAVDHPLFVGLLLYPSYDPDMTKTADFDQSGLVDGADIRGFLESLYLAN